MAKVSKLTFEIITTDVWDDEGIRAIADEFAKLFGGDLNIDSACLVKAEEIDQPHDPDEDGKGIEPIRGKFRATGTCAPGPFDITVDAYGPADAFVEVALSVPGETEVATLVDETGRDVLSDIDPDDPIL